MDPSPLLLPSASTPLRRRPLPLVAAVVPVAAGLALWMTTGAVHALWFAALGPLMLGASLLDTARGRRRERKADALRVSTAWADIEAELHRRHAQERAQGERRHPDAASCIRDRPLRDARPPGDDTPLVVGRGSRASGVRCEGGDDARAHAFRRRCAVLEDAPWVVALGRGVCLRGREPLVQAAARALVIQLCLRFSPSVLSLVGDEGCDPALRALPHAQRARRGGFRLALATGSAGGAGAGADAVIWTVPSGAEVPEGITTVIDIEEPGAATLRTPDGEADLAVEFLSSAQAAAAAELCGARDGAGPAVTETALRDLPQPPAGPGLRVALGTGRDGAPVGADIVEDGPHAIVTGMTGTGKSELLVSWVVAVCAGHGPDRVSFLLADFKGGTAFDRLRGLPQVVGVITDLDETEARRGVASLAAEMRRREAALAAMGARDVRETDLPRLVIVVDEFAALLQEHAELAAVFTDVAARGRALGMHLILGTQRAAGVIRDALATNCPLRISLRVAEAADSRAVIGTGEAADLPGGADGRGRALLRRPQDEEPHPVRTALADDEHIRRIGERWSGTTPSAPPWHPALPTHLPLETLRAGSRTGDRRTEEGPLIVLGRADDPDHQAQPLEVLRPGRERGLAVLGAPGTGRTTALRVIAAQYPECTWFPDDPESAVDQLLAWTEEDGAPSDVVLADDLDALHAALPLEDGQDFVQRWEHLVRSKAAVTWVLAASRAVGPLARVFDALPRRAVLRMPTRVEHLAAGGELAAFRRDRPPGRAVLEEREMQFAWIDTEGVPVRPVQPLRKVAPAWAPAGELTALVTPGAASVVETLASAHPEWDVQAARPETSRTGKPLVLVADAESWQRHWALWQRVRSHGEVLIRAERPSELRQLVGVRVRPPYARPDAGRAWSVIGDRAPRRVVIDALGRR